MMLKKLWSLAAAACFAVFAVWAPAEAEDIDWDDPLAPLVQLPGRSELGVFPQHSPSNNTVRISIDVDGLAIGGLWHQQSGAASAGSNSVRIGSVTVSQWVIGGLIYDLSGAASGSASGNSVALTGTSVGELVAGGRVYSAVASNVGASNNAVSISGGTVGPSNTTDGWVYGGLAEAAGAAGSANSGGNAVNLAYTTVYGSVEGGSAHSDDGSVAANNNRVSVAGGTISWEERTPPHDIGEWILVGGSARIDSGASSGGSAAAGNSVDLQGTHFIGVGGHEFGLGGGYAQSYSAAAATGNTLAAEGVSASGCLSVFGGYAEAYEPPSDSVLQDVMANNNSVSLKGGAFEGVAGGFAEVYVGRAEASGNTVEIDGADASLIMGGGASGRSGNNFTGPTQAFARGNALSGKNGHFANVVGGHAYSLKGWADSSGNIISLDGGSSGLVWGGLAEINGTGAYSAKASGASIYLKDHTTNEVAGGQVDASCYSGPCPAQTGELLAVDNVVTLRGATAVSGSLYGGYISSGLSAPFDVFSGNTLNVYLPGAGGISVHTVRNFEVYNFTFDGSALTSSTVGLRVDSGGLVTLSDGSSRGSRIGFVDVVNGGPPLDVGDEIVLIGGSGSVDSANFTQTETAGAHQGALTDYVYELIVDSSTVKAKVSSVAVSASAKAVSEGFLGGAAVLVQAADHAASAGMESAVTSVTQPSGRGAAMGGPVVSSFGAASGGSVRHKTGSHVDSSGLSVMAGVACGMDFEAARLILGVFAEFGYGDYDTYNSGPGGEEIRSGGRARYLGGGLLARIEIEAGSSGVFYAEASGRLGQVRNKYASPALAGGRVASYTSKTPYSALHFGLGYRLPLSGKDSLDLYAKYFWTRQNSDEVTLTGGERVAFRSVDSRRLRGGLRWSRAATERFGYFAGLAYEREFDGRADAMAMGRAIDSPSMKGGAGIGELGLTVRPSAGGPLVLEFAARGYAGKRQGVTGGVTVKLEF
jgi:hypothetical protein